MSSVSDPTPLHATQTPAAAHDEHHGLAHISPWQTLVKVFAALMILTLLTVAATWVDLGTLNIWVALGIAVIKATLVVLYFMHLKYDNPFNGYVFTFSLAFVAVFLGFVIIDTKSYKHTVEQRRLDETTVTGEPPIIPPNPLVTTAPQPAGNTAGVPSPQGK